MKKMKKAVEDTAVENEELVTIADAIKAESKKRSAGKAKEEQKGLFDDLLKRVPLGWRNLGISAFVRKHFDQFLLVRERFYSWKQIAEVVDAELQVPSRNLPSSLRSAFFRERHRGIL